MRIIFILVTSLLILKKRSFKVAVQEIRYLDKLIDELAKGKTMEKILQK